MKRSCRRCKSALSGVVSLLSTVVILGCGSAQESELWVVDDGPPCSAVQLRRFMADFDSLRPCERYLRIENALRSLQPPYSNRVISKYPDTACPFSRWGISRDPRVEEEMAYHLLVCYASRMGKKWEGEDVVYRISRRRAENERDALTAVHRQSEFLSDLKILLGCADSSSSK